MRVRFNYDKQNFVITDDMIYSLNNKTNTFECFNYMGFPIGTNSELQIYSR